MKHGIKANGSTIGVTIVYNTLKNNSAWRACMEVLPQTVRNMYTYTTYDIINIL